MHPRLAYLGKLYSFHVNSSLADATRENMIISLNPFVVSEPLVAQHATVLLVVVGRLANVKYGDVISSVDGVSITQLSP